MAELKRIPKLIILRPTKAGILRLAHRAAYWKQAFFYADKFKIAVSNVERDDLRDLWIMTTVGTLSAGELGDLLLGEIDT